MSDPSERLRNDLLALVRGRIPHADAEDVVQSALVEALASKTAPKEHEPFRRFAFGIAKNKIIDYYRARKRETLDLPEIEAPPLEVEERSLARWAEERVPEKEKSETLHWMMREGDGEKLEHIADDAGIPAARVRKRVSRLREHLRSHWKKEVALLAAMGIAVAIAFMLLRPSPVEIVHDVPQPKPVPELKIAEELRRAAHDDCDNGRFRECLDKLDRARDQDPTGDALPGVASDRDRARRALSPEVPSAPSSTPAPQKFERKPAVPPSRQVPPAQNRRPPSVKGGKAESRMNDFDKALLDKTSGDRVKPEPAQMVHSNPKSIPVLENGSPQPPSPSPISKKNDK